MEKLIIQGVLYVTTKNSLSGEKVCTNCIFYNEKELCELDKFIHTSCDLHYTLIYKKSINNILKKL